MPQHHGSPHDSIQELSRRAAAGDEAAFRTLHDRFRSGLELFFSRRCAGRSDDVAELSQQTWVLAWDCLRAGRYDPARSAFSTYVYAIALNVWRRSRARVGREVTDEESTLEQIVDRSGAVLDAMHLGELIDAVRDCVRRASGPDALTPTERQIAEGLASGDSERGLADKLGLAASTVNAHKRSSYTKLRRCLGRKGFSDTEIERGGLMGE